jgi:hypothetical protein
MRNVRSGRNLLPERGALAYSDRMSVARFQTDSAVAQPLDRSRDKPIETPLSLERRTKLREELLAETPSWYVPWVHLFVPSSFGIAAIVSDSRPSPRGAAHGSRRLSLRECLRVVDPRRRAPPP